MERKNLLRSLFVVIILVTMQPALFAQKGNVYKFNIGKMEVIALSDGTVPIDIFKLFGENDINKIKDLIKSAYLENPVETSITTYLIRSEDRIILIDTGSGELFGPKHGGSLVNSLNAAGFNPEQITDILLTHIHNDHSGGLSIKGKPIFTNATVHVNKLDADYWLDEDRMEKADSKALSSNKQSFINAINCFKPYLENNQVKAFRGNIEILPGIYTIETPGHTPGHTMYSFENNGEKIIFCGDCVHVAGIQFAVPNLIDGFDVNKPQAIKQREKLYTDAAQQGYLIAGNHISFPGIGRLRKKNTGFEWIPIPYSLEGRTK
jgi:glyoxylase-like metal-dependent hydrolase (beta-lactamase superfamily II)